MRPEDFDIQKFIGHLQGTCKTLQEACQDFGEDFQEEDLTTEDHEAIDSEIFRCTTCDWWYEFAEQSENDDELCTNCDEKEEDEED